jgi:hypothetical protein
VGEEVQEGVLGSCAFVSAGEEQLWWAWTFSEEVGQVGVPCVGVLGARCS